MALEDLSLSNERSQDPTQASGLASLRELAYSGKLPQMSLSMLPQNIVDPAAKWEGFAAGALRPATGGFGEAMSNAFGALAEGRNREAELQAKYLPLVAQALLQRQLQAAHIAQMQWKLSGEFDQSGVSALTPLLTKEGDITGADVAQALGGAVQRGLIPPESARQLYATLPTTDPNALRDALNRLTIGKLDSAGQRGAVTPKVSLEDTGEVKQPIATPPGQPGQSGPVGAAIPKRLTPGEVLGAKKVEKDQAGNPVVVDTLKGTQGFPSPTSDAPPRQTVAGGQFAKEEGQRYSKYATELGSQLSAMRGMQQRIGEMRQYATTFQPGATAEARLQLGRWVKDVGVTVGLSPEQADAIGQKIAGGDISSAQAFKKLAAQGAMEALKSAMQTGSGAGAGRITQAEFAIFLRNNPDIASDPQALDKMFNFITKQYQTTSVEQHEFSQYVKERNGDPTGWDAAWDQRAKELGFVAPAKEDRTAKGSPGKPSKTPIGTSASGRRMKLTNEGWVYE
jgi:hypothetical protein